MGDCMNFPDTVDEYMEQYKMTNTKQVYSNGIEYVPIFRMKQWFEPEKAQLSQEGTTSDLISRQAVINAIENTNAKMSMPEWDEITNAVMSLPTVQPEPSIPLSWIEKYIEWLKSLDNEFANLAAAHISVMVKKWRDEQDETN